MSKKVSIVKATLIGVRVAGDPVYTPAHIPAGGQKPNRQMCTVSVVQNVGEKKNTYKLTAWGVMADVVAKSCAPGKDLTVLCDVHVYQGRVPMPAAPGAPVNFVMNANGQPLLVSKVGFTIENIHFGADSERQLAAEIQCGARPRFWNVVDHADYAAWKSLKDQRNAIRFAPGLTRFGYAMVKTPNGQIIDPATINNYNATGTATVNQYAGNPAAVGGGFAMPNSPVAAPVLVNGQNMGYAMPNVNPGYAAPAVVQQPVSSAGSFVM